MEELEELGVNFASKEPMTVDELETAIKYHRELYGKSVPSISDDDFDRLVFLLQTCDPENALLAEVAQPKQIEEAPKQTSDLMQDLFEAEDENILAELAQQPKEMPEEVPDHSTDTLMRVLGLESKDDLESIGLPLELGIKRLRETAILPTQATERSACFDVYASGDRTILCGQVTTVPTALHLVIPEGCRVSVRPRSGLAVKEGVVVVNSPGTIDEDYPGELFVALTKLTWGEGGPTGQNAFYQVKKGDRIAQICVEPVEPVVLIDTNETAERTDRKGGLGSTGR